MLTTCHKLHAVTGEAADHLFTSLAHSYNSYFASKSCTYTDASGRPVPAPRPCKPDMPDPPHPDARQTSFHSQSSDHFSSPGLQAPQISGSYSAPPILSQVPTEDPENNENARKRFRSENGKQPISSESMPADVGPVNNLPVERSVGLDHSLTRELVNRKTLSHSHFFTTLNFSKYFLHIAIQPESSSTNRHFHPPLVTTSYHPISCMQYAQ
jgi:hypothetical protein